MKYTNFSFIDVLLLVIACCVSLYIFPTAAEPVTSRQVISTPNAPKAIGPYSQAIKVNNTVYLSGQIPLIPETMTLQTGDMEAQIRQVFSNLQAVASAAGGDLGDIAKLNIFLTDLSHYALVNKIMGEYFKPPYPARAAVGVASLPKDVPVEIEAILVLSDKK